MGGAHGTLKEFPDMTTFTQMGLGKRLDTAVGLYLKYGSGVPTSKYLAWLCWHIFQLSLLATLVKLTTPKRKRSGADEQQWDWWDTAYFKFNAWFYLLEVSGFGMAFGMDWKPRSWYFRFVPGTMKSPMLKLPWLGHRRTPLDVLLHTVSALAAVRVLLKPRVDFRSMRPIVLSELVAAVLDWTPMHHLFYNFLPMVALCFPFEHGGLAGAQLAICGLYFFSGLAKHPVWAGHLNASFFAHSRLFVGKDWVRRLLYQGGTEGKLSALLTPLAHILSPVPFLIEGCGSLALALSHSVGLPALARLGHLALMAMHASIVSSMPLDIGTFNVYYAVSATYIFRWRSRGLDVRGLQNMHPLLACALTLKTLYVAYGFARPHNVHYLQGWRVWAGNWTLSWLLVRRSVLSKIMGAQPTWAQHPIPGPAPSDFGAYMGMAYQYTLNLSAKGVAAMLTRAVQGIKEEDYALVDLLGLQNLLMGQTWGDVNVMYMMRQFLVKEWSLQEGDMRLLVASALPWSPLRVGDQAWQLHDMQKGLIASGICEVGKLQQACVRPSFALEVPGLLGEK